MAKKVDFFSRMARATAKKSGQAGTFGVAVIVIIVWAITGPLFKFSDTWQLVINTSTTIVTFLMVFLIQNTQNRDSEAMHLKMDELIRSSAAHNSLLDIEELTEKELDLIKLEYANLAARARPELQEPVFEGEEATPPVKKQRAPGRKRIASRRAGAAAKKPPRKPGT